MYKTNILGSHNVIDAALNNDIKKVVALSSDKAVSPPNVYGASKLTLEKLFLYANLQNKTRFSVVRFANVFASKGSVVPFFIEKKKDGYLPITHPGMTRFSITLQDAIDLVMFGIQQGWGGEIIIPISPSYKITDVAEAIAPGIEHRIIGVRQGEKLHESMFTESDADNTVKHDKYYIICPAEGPWSKEKFCNDVGAVPLTDKFEYHSGNNSEWLTIDQIRELISTEIPNIK